MYVIRFVWQCANAWLSEAMPLQWTEQTHVNEIQSRMNENQQETIETIVSLLLNIAEWPSEFTNQHIYHKFIQ